MFNESIASDKADFSLTTDKATAASSSAYGFDFDSNSNPDVLWYDSTSKENLLWLMEGNNSDQYRVSVDIDARSGSWSIKSAADLNADGQTDLLWHNHRTGEAEAWFMTNGGTQRIGTAAIQSPNADWGMKGIGDFNQDNQADLLWHNNRTGENSVWFMGGETGTEVLDKRNLESLAPIWDIAGVGDFDQDSHADIVFHNDKTGESVIWFMEGEDGTDKRSQSFLAQRDLDWRINGIADFNQDGQVDVFWRHRGLDNPVVWQMSAGENPQFEAEIVLPAMSNRLHPTVSGWQRSEAGSDASDSSDNTAEVVSVPSAEIKSADTSEEDGFDIQFDYRFDTSGWFDNAKKETLEKAAEIWENIILDDFENIKAGETVHASKPDGSGFEAFTLDYEIDDVVVFAYASDTGNSLAEAGATTYEGDRNTSTLFQPWLGEVEFNFTENWFVDANTNSTPDVPATQVDFLSVAVHEIGHILGISSSISAFESFIDDQGKFTGEKSSDINNGDAIPLDRRGSHIKDGFEVAGLGENALDPSLKRGTRKLLTILDVALLDDIGYTVDYSSLKPIPELNALGIQTQKGSDITQLQTGDTYVLRWDDNLSEQVKIELYEGNTYVRTILNDTPSNGNVNWQVPEELAEGLAGDRYYRLKFSSAEDSSIYSFSDRPFTIQAKPFLDLSSLDISRALNTVDISWSDNLKETIKIELYQGGEYSRTITNSTASDGSYQWNIPRYIDSGDNYQFRLTSRDDSSLYDFSETFSIAR